MLEFWKLIRLGVILLLGAALIPISAAVAAAQTEGADHTMVGLQYEASKIDAAWVDELHKTVAAAFEESQWRFVDFKSARNQMNPVTRDCFTPDCLGKIGEEFSAGAGLSVNMSGEAEIYKWTIDVWDLRGGQRFDSTSGTCELCGRVELKRAFEDSVKAAIAKAAPLAQAAAGGSAAATPPEPAKAGPGQILLHVSVLPKEAEIFINDQFVAYGEVTRPVSPGAHDVHIQMEGYRDIKERVLVNRETGGPIVLRMHLTPTNPEVVDVGGSVGPIDRLGSMRTTLGFVGVGVGIFALGTGIYLVAIDGDPSCDADVPAIACPDVYATAGGGMAMGVLGTALITGGVTLLSWELLAGESNSESEIDAPDSDDSMDAGGRDEEGPAALSLTPAVGSDGAGLLLRGSF